jgi:hypothetical protein
MEVALLIRKFIFPLKNASSLKSPRPSEREREKSHWARLEILEFVDSFHSPGKIVCETSNISGRSSNILN